MSVVTRTGKPLLAGLDVSLTAREHASQMQDLQAPPVTPSPSVDWDLVRSLYLQGMTPKNISERTGAKAGLVSVRANRGKWKATLTQTNAILKGAPEHATVDSESKLGASSERTRTRLARLVERSAEKIEEMTLRSPAHALRVNSELESVVRNAKTVFGWSDSTQAPAVRIAIMSQTTLVKVDAGQPTSQPAIDVASEVVPCVEEKELLNPQASTGQTDP